jgi:hypothetical protein
MVQTGGSRRSEPVRQTARSDGLRRGSHDVAAVGVAKQRLKKNKQIQKKSFLKERSFKEQEQERTTTLLKWTRFKRTIGFDARTRGFATRRKCRARTRCTATWPLFSVAGASRRWTCCNRIADGSVRVNTPPA